MTDVVQQHSRGVASDGPRIGPRITSSVVLIVAIYGVVLAIARAMAETASNGPSAWRLLASTTLGIAIVPVVASPIEWMVHRHVYHSRSFGPLSAINTVHLAHHHAYFPTWRYVTSGPSRRLPVTNGHIEIATRPVANAFIRFTHFAWYMSFGLLALWIPGWLITRNAAFVVGLVIASAIVSNLFVTVHDTIHRPGSHRLIESQPWFAFLDRHHYIHHVDLMCNLNFLLPLADLMFGTLRTRMTDAEIRRHGTLETAKSMVSGSGERARRRTDAA